MTAVYIGIAAAVVFALVLLYSLLRAADLGDQMFEHELSEIEVHQHIYPQGNVVLLESRPNGGEAETTNKEKD